MRKKKIDHECVSSIVCPHCGVEPFEFWNIGGRYEEGSFEIKCEACGQDYIAHRHEVRVFYSTEKKILKPEPKPIEDKVIAAFREKRKNFLIDAEAIHRANGYSKTEAKERAMSDWHVYGESEFGLNFKA